MPTPFYALYSCGPCPFSAFHYHLLHHALDCCAGEALAMFSNITPARLLGEPRREGGSKGE